VSPVVSHYRKPVPVRSWHAAAPRWPGGSGLAVLDAGAAAGLAPGALAPGRAGARARAGSLPLWIAPLTSSAAAGTAGGNAAADAGRSPASAAASVPPEVVATFAATSVARRAGVDGVLFSVRREDGVRAAEHVRVILCYGQFVDAFGGDWASRLRLVAMPACVLTAPDVPACRVQTPLRSSNDAQSATVAAPVSVPAAGLPAAAPLAPGALAGGGAYLSPAQRPAMTVIAASSAPGGGGGDYTATSLQPSGSWGAGGSADAFTWTYPIPVPAVPGGWCPRCSFPTTRKLRTG
jgi:hypothetical protein